VAARNQTQPPTKEFTMFRIIATAAILALTATAAHAAGPAVVRFGDLDLSKPADARILAGRVQTAAEAACTEWKPRVEGEKSWAFYNMTHESCLSTITRSLTSQVMASAAAHRPRVASN